ncbi:MAG: hypothetical protein IKL92_01510, partial [Oscillospiraceae bacterium]|nr:hypothetical protein [Oscillospiraceae bacterium]
MARSMTGFGRSEQLINGRRIAVEIKSVNHRYFEFSTRMPRTCNFMEDKLKSLLQSRISRGKVDLSISMAQIEGTQSVVRANPDLAKSYLDALRAVAEATGLNCDVNVSTVARFPDVITVEAAEIDPDSLWADVKLVAEETLEAFIAMRETEGEKLKEDVLSRLDTIEALAKKVEEESPKTLEAYRNRLYQKISDVLADRTVDDARVLTEVA